MLISKKINGLVDTMIRKISTLAFIFLTIFLIGSVSAAEIENETAITENTPLNDVDISTDDVEMFYKDGTRFSAEINDENENPMVNETLTFTLNGIDYTRQTNANGQTSIPLNLNSGKYIVTTTFNGNDKYNANSINNTVNIKSTINADDVTKVYRNSTQYYAKFITSKGEIIKNREVEFNINGVFYKRTTNESGMAKLNLNLEQGKYILTAKNPVTGEMKSNLITILPTITNNRDVVKYYRNATKYQVTLIGDDGKIVGAGETVEFNINGVFYYRNTKDNGIASLNLNLEPGNYIITAQYKNCRVSNNIKILSTIRADDIVMSYKDGTKFKAYLVDGAGNPAENEEITFNINGILYTRTTKENGVASLNINLEVGTYIITSEHNGLKASNKITVNPKITKEDIKSTDFTYEIKIPNYVNVTYPYVFENSAYTVKSGIDGIIKMNKNLLINIQIGHMYYTFSTNTALEYGATYLGYESYLLPFDSPSYQHNYDQSKLTGNGIIIYKSHDYVHLIYRNNCTSNVEQFGAYIDKYLDKSEIINYVQNGEITAKIQFQTTGFDELGLKYSLSKYHNRLMYEFDVKSYDEIIHENTKNIKFVNTNESVTFNYFKTAIAGYLSEEYIITKFSSANCIEFEKEEMITYGLSDKYKLDFDVMQSFAIINKKMTNKDMNDWISKESEYKSNAGMKSIYTMFMTCLNTAYLSDKLADELSDEYNVRWSRENNTVILGAMNWKDTYQHVLSPNMGLAIKGDNESDIIKFRFANSILLSKIEQYSLKPIAEDAGSNLTSSFDDIFKTLASYKVSVVYYNNTAFISDESGNSTFVIDLISGLVTPLTIKDGFAYKGATVTRDCGLCSINSMAKGVMKTINNVIQDANDVLSLIGDNILPINSLVVKGALISKGLIGALISGSINVGITLFGTAASIQSIGVYCTENLVDDKNLHATYDTITFTRPGYLQNTKIYNIPQKDGSVDYVEIPIKKDNTLDRDNVRYISDGNVRILTKEETYQYFTEEKWEPYSVPKMYWR